MSPRGIVWSLHNMITTVSGGDGGDGGGGGGGGGWRKLKYQVYQ